MTATQAILYFDSMAPRSEVEVRFGSGCRQSIQYARMVLRRTSTSTTIPKSTLRRDLGALR